MPETSRPRGSDVLRLCAGPLVWLVHLTIIYGATRWACARGQEPFTPSVVGVVTLTSLAVTAWLLAGAVGRWRSAPPERRQMALFVTAITALTAVGIVWGALPFLFDATCL